MDEMIHQVVKILFVIILGCVVCIYATYQIPLNPTPMPIIIFRWVEYTIIFLASSFIGLLYYSRPK